MRTIIWSILIFVASSFAGPLVRWATWPPKATGGFADFMYDLVLLLWPTQPLTVVEASAGTFAAIVLSVGANALLFGVVGALAGILGSKRAALLALYMAACAMLIAFALWGFGFPMTYSNAGALVAVAFLYALLFFAVFRLAGNIGIKRARFE